MRTTSPNIRTFITIGRGIYLSKKDARGKKTVIKGQYGPVKLNDGRLGYYDGDKCIRFHACMCLEKDKERCAHVTGIVFLGHPHESRSILIHYNFMEPIERLEIDDAVYTR